MNIMVGESPDAGVALIVKVDERVVAELRFPEAGQRPAWTPVDPNWEVGMPSDVSYLLVCHVPVGQQTVDITYFPLAEPKPIATPAGDIVSHWKWHETQRAEGDRLILEIDELRSRAGRLPAALLNRRAQLQGQLVEIVRDLAQDLPTEAKRRWLPHVVRDRL